LNVPSVHDGAIKFVCRFIYRNTWWPAPLLRTWVSSALFVYRNCSTCSLKQNHIVHLQRNG
jgi:hypothetical protein